jgi:uncharacterized protein
MLVMSTLDPLHLPIAELVRRPGAARDFDIAVPLTGFGNGVATVDPAQPAHIDGRLEHVPEGVVVRATIEAPWAAACSRCLRPVGGTVTVHVDELFERAAIEGETYPLGEDELDLTPLVRDALLLELPSAPRCTEDCAGICPMCGADRNVAPCDCVDTTPDPRWAALRALDL